MLLAAEPDERIDAPPAEEMLKDHALTATHRLKMADGALVGGERVRHRFWYLGKRTIDLVFSILIAIFFMPLLLATWVAIRFDSPGPGLFWSYRVGLRGRLFAMPKFRTMTLGAPLAPREDLGSIADQYTRPLGRLLRKSSIDEIPQLWCIARGDMSFIGPRPLLPDDEAIAERKSFPVCLEVLPGISGVSQIRGRNYVTPRRKARYDSFYAKNCSIPLDLYILLETIVVVFTKRGMM
jgi:O-antigen biosynthesis protein WbqP